MFWLLRKESKRPLCALVLQIAKKCFGYAPSVKQLDLYRTVEEWCAGNSDMVQYTVHCCTLKYIVVLLYYYTVQQSVHSIVETTTSSLK